MNFMCIPHLYTLYQIHSKLKYNSIFKKIKMLNYAKLLCIKACMKAVDLWFCMIIYEKWYINVKIRLLLPATHFPLWLKYIRKARGVKIKWGWNQVIGECVTSSVSQIFTFSYIFSNCIDIVMKDIICTYFETYCKHIMREKNKRW